MHDNTSSLGEVKKVMARIANKATEVAESSAIRNALVFLLKLDSSLVIVALILNDEESQNKTKHSGNPDCANK